MGRTIWLGLMALVVVAGIAVPYGPLAGREGTLAVPLFWLAFGFVVIGLIAVAVARWRAGE